MDKTSKIQSYLDGVDGLYVVGWVWDPENPDKRLEVVVYVDGEPVAEGVADQYREDLEKAGIGDGKYGFRVELRDVVLDGEFHEVEIKVKEPNVTPIRKTLKFEKKLSQNSIRVILDDIQGGIASGWAANLNDFTEKLEVVLYIDGVPTKKTIANVFREDLLKAGIGDGCHSFLIQIPEEFLDGREHEIRVKSEKYNVFSSQVKKFIALPEHGNISKPENTLIIKLLQNIDQNDPIGSIIDILYHLQLKIDKLSREIIILKSQPPFRELLLPHVKENFLGTRSLKIDPTMSLKPEQGFYHLEMDSNGNPFRWTGPEPTFYFDVHIDRSIPLKFRLLVYIKDFEQAKIRCYIDNVEIPLYTDFDSEGTIYNGIIFPRDVWGLTRINFTVPKMLPPTESDSRTFGVIFKKFEISPAIDEDIENYLKKFKY